ncbi:polysaccharide pyruvyl transferase WcaK-like protein [Microbacterium sp. SORGH_AS 505]|uniref:polysaccharide pyruvyl transferase family protein n=1 Tax=Microbacterium sp. SORGH_AS_0505 TaxID=3041770 RepID=UPI0027843A90|nr:polysaccharide pyruvyl transferase family protein [Microbacterium sp. SORGH_AS_0505]MDQ1125488.1 polysaccharide pyruvyl transferase WcaK-like protein [Microbacterium sp. SORGH_AS_0505]
MPRELHAFLSLVAQDDNLGDLVIRRRVFDLADASVHRLHVLIDDMPRDFLEPFRLDSRQNVSVYTNPRGFSRAMLAQAIRQRAILVLSPGPEHIRRGVLGGVQLVAQIGRTLVLRSLGARVVAIGRSVLGRKRSGVLAAASRLSAALSNVYFARDHFSVNLLASKSVRYAPDVAFSEGTSSELLIDSKDIAAFSFRAEGMPTDDQFRIMAASVREHGLKPVLVSQVRRDDEVHRQLSTAASCDALLWGERSHAEQLDAVMKTYDTSRLVISNRLHALILGAVQRAIPVPFSRQNGAKTVETLSPVLVVDRLEPDLSNIEDVIAKALAEDKVESTMQGVRIAAGSVATAAAELFVYRAASR